MVEAAAPVAVAAAAAAAELVEAAESVPAGELAVVAESVAEAAPVGRVGQWVAVDPGEEVASVDPAAEYVREAIGPVATGRAAPGKNLCRTDS